MPTCEAEFIAGSAAAQKTVWLRSIVHGVSLTTNRPTPLMIDNTGVAELAADNKASRRSKHRYQIPPHDMVRSRW
ncbi:MAG: hypothetical protein BJ554DRAFT_377 [Olpidium bornovanus]|uniref:Uncharacterized protein n=1 Tax=Olpidium bornovanus TaxID=278681 RepID=A0A8H8A1S8_9FUNG|nr:MAG: hypothetical protein BJ554DRAFT_377 [Olpidium bornovanus]